MTVKLYKINFKWLEKTVNNIRTQRKRSFFFQVMNGENRKRRFWKNVHKSLSEDKLFDERGKSGEMEFPTFILFTPHC